MFSFVYRNLFKTARPEVDCGVESGSVKDELDRWKSLRPLLPVDAAGGGEAAAGGEAAGRGLGVSTEGTSGPSLSIVSQLGDGSLSAEVFRAAAAEELLKNLNTTESPGVILLTSPILQGLTLQSYVGQKLKHKSVFSLYKQHKDRTCL